MHVPRARQRGVSYVTIAMSGNYTWPITLKLHMHIDTHPTMYLYVSQLGCYCTCARTRQWLFQISRTAEQITLKLGILIGTG